MSKKVRVEARVDPELKAAVEKVLEREGLSMTEHLTKCLEWTKEFKCIPDIYEQDYLNETVADSYQEIKQLKQELAELKKKQRGGWFNSLQDWLFNTKDI